MTSKERKTSLLADGALFVMAFIWGSGFVFMKASLDAYSAIQLISVRMLIGAIALGLFNIKRLIRTNKSEIFASFVISLSLFGGFLFQTMGLETTTAGNSAFLTATYVVMVPMIVIVFSKRKPDLYNIIAAVLMLFGIFMLTSVSGGPLIKIGDVYTLICAVFFSLQIVLIDRYTEKHDPMVLAVLQMFFASAIGFVAMIFTGGYPLVFPKETISTVMYLGIVASGVTFMIQNVAQKYTSPTHAGILMSLESVFGCLLGILILGEIMTMKIAIGCAVIFIALIIAETKLNFLKRKEKKELSADEPY
ncbi:MAG: DMT family transporter [Anaerofustis sp.]